MILALGKSVALDGISNVVMPRPLVKMIGSTAETVVALVENPTANGSSECQPENESMRPHRPSIHGENTIAFLRVADPIPTAGGRFDVFPKALGDGSALHSICLGGAHALTRAEPRLARPLGNAGKN